MKFLKINDRCVNIEYIVGFRENNDEYIEDEREPDEDLLFYEIEWVLKGQHGSFEIVTESFDDYQQRKKRYEECLTKLEVF